MILEALAFLLGSIHFGIPLAYYTYLKRFVGKPWNIEANYSYKPKITVIIPTYNEAKIIEERLENIYSQDYPKELMEVIIVDSSNDETANIAESWAEGHSFQIKLIKQARREGKARALNLALKNSIGEIVIIGDADASWPKDALTEAVKWLSNSSVGAVSCLKAPIGEGAGVEEEYRRYYNALRLAESKIFATPIFHGEFSAFKNELLFKVEGFPEHIGADDSHTAAKIAILGYRAIMPETLSCKEAIPRKGEYLQWRVRRAQHLIQHFLSLSKALKHMKCDRKFKWIITMESFLHLVNPWLMLIAFLLLIIAATAFHSIVAIILLATGLALLSLKQYRMWMIQQIHLMVAAIKNMKSKAIVWEKQNKQY